jgi:hypothetical protein
VTRSPLGSACNRRGSSERAAMGERESEAVDTDMFLCLMCKQWFDTREHMTEHLAEEHLAEIVAHIREDQGPGRA